MPSPTRRRVLARTLASTTALLGAPLIGLRARAQAAYPSRSIRIVGAFAPGGPSDAISRAVGQRLTDTWGQPVIVDPRPGASGMIGAEIVAKAPADGHTLLVTNQLLVQVPSLYAKAPYEPLRDFTAVTDLIAAPPLLAINAAASEGIRTLADFVRQGKATPQGFHYASVGNGSIGHLYGSQFGQATGIGMTHVPYKGASPVVMALLAGEVQASFVDYATLKPHLASGKLRALAIADTRRSPLVPELPTFTELGMPGFEAVSWIALFAPAKTPADTVHKLAAEVGRALRQPEVATRYQEQGFEIGGKSPAQFGSQVAADMERWAALIRQTSVRLD
jgi:tripartite-type tricarboxylate transporter receptor subunit TctC